MKKILILFIGIFFFNCEKKTDIIDETKLSPLEKLVKGNQRFINHKAIKPHQDENYLNSIETQQNPFAVIVSCSDSRVSPSLIFDQGFGDLFIIRNAGNLIDNLELGSIEYAVNHLNVELIVVLGHTNCGAMQAFMKHPYYHEQNHIKDIIDYIKNESEIQSLDIVDKNNLNKIITANVNHGVKTINKDKTLNFKNKKTKIVGAIYDLKTRKVTFVT
jgi:carbonic anhydrase